MSFVSITTWRMVGETENFATCDELMKCENTFRGFWLWAQHIMPWMLIDRFAIVTVLPSREVRNARRRSYLSLRIRSARGIWGGAMDAYGGEMLAASEA